MDYQELLKQARQNIDVIDKEMTGLFLKRMQISSDVAMFKLQGNMALTDEGREQSVVDKARESAQDELKGEVAIFMRSLIALSKSWQRKRLFDEDKRTFLPDPREPVKGNVIVAYQGVPGAWGEIASLKLFKNAARSAQDSFEDVFQTVKERKAHYGIVPIENSRTGAIGEVYDLLRGYGCYIVGQAWVPVKQCLLGIPGANVDDVREVFSHPQGFSQCRDFLKGKGWDLAACRNTAVAAEMVAAKKDGRFAAIGSVRAAELNGLSVLVPDISTDAGNKTRFIVIANGTEYDGSSNIVSVIFHTAHRSGALCEVLFPIMAEGVNLTRIESRPAAGGKYCFFLDLEGHINDEPVQAALHAAAASCDYLEVLGCYAETD